MAIGKKTGGRKKGVPNKLTQDIRAAISEAFDRAGGVNYLVALAKDEPKTFIPLLAKIVPQENINKNFDMTELSDRLQAGRDRIAAEQAKAKPKPRAKK
tara:strand:- start:116 stop:412 length:297 start_codon:yes stop_codon:yes gene_type:complete